MRVRLYRTGIEQALQLAHPLMIRARPVAAEQSDFIIVCKFRRLSHLL
jgi:hypothetical protein